MIESQQREAREQAEKLKRRILEAKTRFTKSKRFQEWVRNVFEAVDLDKSGALGVQEAYIAVLQLYVQIAGVCKGAKPPPWEHVEELFDSCVAPGRDELNVTEFQGFCEILCSEIASRVAVQMFLQSAVAPLLGLLVLDLWTRLMEHVAPELYAYCSSHVPPALIVTLVVGTAVSFFVPPLMEVIDRYFLAGAKLAPETERPTGLHGSFSAVKGEVAVTAALETSKTDAWCCMGRPEKKNE
mmetsp:Transcript_21944/g.38569  ORF Transcript_21944/g.38569 Transcript_21944/m.38569 type:complete len:241 (-) Transcript_21944:11-733(-)